MFCIIIFLLSLLQKCVFLCLVGIFHYKYNVIQWYSQNNSIVVLIVLFVFSFLWVYNFVNVYFYLGYCMSYHFWYFNNHICKIGNWFFYWCFNWFYLRCNSGNWHVLKSWFYVIHQCARVHFAYIIMLKKLKKNKKSNNFIVGLTES